MSTQHKRKVRCKLQESAPRAGKPKASDVQRRPANSGLIHRGAAVLAGLGWFWAAGLLVLREHWPLLHFVAKSVPSGWGIVALPLNWTIFLTAVATALAWAAYRAGQRRDAAVLPAPTAWLLAAWIIPLGSLLRLAGMPIARTFFEALLLAGVTGAAAGAIASTAALCDDNRPSKPSRLALAAVVIMAAAVCVWWIFQGVTAFDDYLLGYCDFAQYGWRVANTWAGRGFLMETPSLPAFWDHVCPAVALLAPIWGATHDARLFIVLQALCLSLPAVLIYFIVRRWGGGGATACVWAAAYLVFPAVGQLNLNYSYGWHPVSVAMALFFAAMLALVAGRKGTAGVLAAFACTWQDYVCVNLAWFAFVMMMVAWWNRRSRGETALPAGSHVPLADMLAPRTWFLTAGASALYFIAIYQLTPFSHEETARFGSLGQTPAEIVLSPVLQPEEFWGTVFRPRAFSFLLALAVPLGLSNLWRGWKTLLGAALPLGVLVAWDFPAATSIAFQYHPLTLPVLFMAAISGAMAAGGNRQPGLQNGDPATVRESLPAHGLWTGGIAALATGLTASLAMGAMPWSSPTMTGMIMVSYPDRTPGENAFAERRTGSAGNDALDRIVARVGQEDAYVLATGRIAAHLLRVERLEPVGTARGRWSEFAAQAASAGRGRSAIELFDWVVLDFRELFCQSEKDMKFIAAEAEQAGFQRVHSDHEILVYQAPD